MCAPPPPCFFWSLNQISLSQGVQGGRAKRYSSQRQRPVPEPPAPPVHISIMEGHYYDPCEFFLIVGYLSCHCKGNEVLSLLLHSGYPTLSSCCFLHMEELEYQRSAGQKELLMWYEGLWFIRLSIYLTVQFQGPIYTHGDSPAPLPPQGMIVQPEMHLPHPGKLASLLYAYSVQESVLGTLQTLPFQHCHAIQ